MHELTTLFLSSCKTYMIKWQGTNQILLDWLVIAAQKELPHTIDMVCSRDESLLIWPLYYQAFAISSRLNQYILHSA